MQLPETNQGEIKVQPLLKNPSPDDLRGVFAYVEVG